MNTPIRQNGYNHFLNWPKYDIGALQSANSLKELRMVAKRVIKNWSVPDQTLHLVSCHTTTGWSRIGMTPEMLEDAIVYLYEYEDPNIFSQMPFLPKLREIALEYRAGHPNDPYCKPIISEFYEPLFDSVKFRTVHFVKGFKGLVGASGEFHLCRKYRIGQRIFSTGLSARFVQRHAKAA